MSNEEYLAAHGQCCPQCGSHDISGGFVDIDGATAWQEVHCGACNSTWRDVYELKHYEALEAGPVAVVTGVAGVILHKLGDKRYSVFDGKTNDTLFEARTRVECRCWLDDEGYCLDGAIDEHRQRWIRKEVA